MASLVFKHMASYYAQLIINFHQILFFTLALITILILNYSRSKNSFVIKSRNDGDKEKATPF